MSQYDVAIVGAGPAGMTAAIYAVRANLKVILLDKLAPGGQMLNTHEIQNYTGMGTINGAELAIKMLEHTQGLGMEFDYGTVVALEQEGTIKKLICEEGHSFEAKAVIIATGTKPKMLGVPGELNFAGTSISWCAICDGPHYHNKKVIIIGGGNSAAEEAIYLASLAKEVTVVTLFNLTADPLVCKKLRALPNVKIYEYFEILEFTGAEKFTGLRAKSAKTGEELIVQGDGAFEYIGLNPTADAFKELGILNEYGYIETDDFMATKMPGIFGAGDITSKHLRQVITACSDGAIAAQSAAKYIEKRNETTGD